MKYGFSVVFVENVDFIIRLSAVWCELVASFCLWQCRNLLGTTNLAQVLVGSKSQFLTNTSLPVWNTLS